MRLPILLIIVMLFIDVSNRWHCQVFYWHVAGGWFELCQWKGWLAPVERSKQ